MWNSNELKQLEYVAERLNEIIGTTHYMKLSFDAGKGIVKLYNLSDANNKNIIGTVNVQDDSPKSFLNDVLEAVNSL